MKVKIPRLLLAAPRSGSGKTVLTCAILKALIDQGYSCRSFKCGPDYIDPLFHRLVLGIPGGNLDTWFSDEHQVVRQLIQGGNGADCTVIEGVMGFYDGVAGTDTQASAYDVARVTNTPVILILDARGASLSLAAVLNGFLKYRDGHHIKGVILNRTSSAMGERLRPFLEELGVRYLGCFPECEEARLESRHLGLALPDELGALKTRLGKLAEKLSGTVFLEELLSIAAQAADFEVDEPAPLPESCGGGFPCTRSGKWEGGEKKVRIAVARDRAFSFYYEENLRLLEELGGELAFFSPLKDPSLPPGIQGILLGGGYPELYAECLESNAGLRMELRTRILSGLPVIAECGGFLYLHDQLEGQDGENYQMAGVIQGRAFRTKKLGRFGYIELENTRASFLLPEGERIRGHEFHYWDSTKNGEDWLAKKPLSARKWHCMHEREGFLAGFPHLYYPSNPALLCRWLRLCQETKEKAI